LGDTGKRKRGSSEGEEKRPPGETKTPRSAYAEKFFSDNKSTIHLLDHYGDYDYVLFQVNYNDVSQFTEYENLDLVHPGHKKDCVIQSIFALGIRDVELSKQSSFDANTYGESGVTHFELNNYIRNAFDLPETTSVTAKYIDILDDDDDDEFEHYNYANTDDKYVDDYDPNGYNFYMDDKLTPEEKNDKTVTFFDRRLKNGYATTIGVSLSRKGGDKTQSSGHRIVVYKHNNQIHFFDPQQKLQGLTLERDGDTMYVNNPNGKGGVVRNVYNSRNLYDLISERVDINGVTYICIRNLQKPKPLVNTSCDLPYMR
jgi:hypothetical protein